MRFLIFGIGFFVSSILFFGCMTEPEGYELVKHMVVQTEYNTDFVNETENVFDVYATFVIREDTMGFVSTSSAKEYIIESDVPDFVEPVVDSIRDGFISSGYELVTLQDDPDFSVNVIVLQNFNYFQSINYGYGYPGSYYYGYYNYYYPVVTTYYSNYVTLVIQVVDAKNPNGSNEFPIIWSASIGDLNATSDLTGKTLEAVDQAFRQSPYIKQN